MVQGTRSPLAASYDFVALIRRPGLDLVTDVESRVVDPPVGSAHERADRDQLVTMLRDLHPSLSPFLFAVDLDLGPHAPVRLVSPDERGAVHVAVHDDHVCVSLPFWHSEDAARVTLRHAWEYLKVACHHGGFEVYDAHQERVVSFTTDWDVVLSAYIAAGHTVAQLALESTAGFLPAPRA